MQLSVCSRNAKKQKSREAEKQKRREAEKQRSRKAEKQESREAGKQRSRNPQKKSKTCRKKANLKQIQDPLVANLVNYCNGPIDS